MSPTREPATIDWLARLAPFLSPDHEVTSSELKAFQQALEQYVWTDPLNGYEELRKTLATAWRPRDPEHPAFGELVTKEVETQCDMTLDEWSEIADRYRRRERTPPGGRSYWHTFIGQLCRQVQAQPRPDGTRGNIDLPKAFKFIMGVPHNDSGCQEGSKGQGGLVPKDVKRKPQGGLLHNKVYENERTELTRVVPLKGLDQTLSCDQPSPEYDVREDAGNRLDAVLAKARLTPKEYEALSLFGENPNLRQAARDRGLNPSTVETYKARALKKCRASLVAGAAPVGFAGAGALIGYWVGILTGLGPILGTAARRWRRALIKRARRSRGGRKPL